jgi:hypothetical protein
MSDINSDIKSDEFETMKEDQQKGTPPTTATDNNNNTDTATNKTTSDPVNADVNDDADVDKEKEEEEEGKVDTSSSNIDNGKFVMMMFNVIISSTDQVITALLCYWITDTVTGSQYSNMYLSDKVAFKSFSITFFLTPLLFKLT